MRIVVTGGAGFLGSHLCDKLLEEGHQVICIDNLITGSVSNIEHHDSNENFKFIKQDVTEFLYISGPVDYVFHFASPASPIDYLKFPIPTLKVGALGTHKTLGLAKDKKASFLLASTSEVYGDPLVNPQPESYWGNVNPIGPRGVYDEAKRFAEALTMAYHRYHGVNTHIVRIFNTYGPRMRKQDGRAVPNFINQALKGEGITVYGDGLQTRSFCFISDLIDGIYRLATSNINTPVNIGNPQEVTIKQCAETIIKLTGSRSRITYHDLPVDDPKVRRPDITVAQEELGWEPRVLFEEGLKKTIEWFKKS
ncbi:MAG: SDR family oxidoreductase [Candidatus Aureabacteria bacterium]|nr:SDR family oxidoreductase [Candidatus Auribacterota bacterium]